MPHIGVNYNTLGDPIKHIIAQMCVAVTICLCICYMHEIFEVSLALKKIQSGNNLNRITDIFAVLVTTGPGCPTKLSNHTYIYRCM